MTTSGELFLWKFHWDCGRQGYLNGLFVATEEAVKNAIGREVHFGEVLGKHSDVYGTIEEGEITKVEVSSKAVEELASVLGDNWSGYNPLEYIGVTCGECGSDTREAYEVNEKEKCEDCMTEEDWDIYYGREDNA